MRHAIQMSYFSHFLRMYFPSSCIYQQHLTVLLCPIESINALQNAELRKALATRDVELAEKKVSRCFSNYTIERK